MLIMNLPIGSISGRPGVTHVGSLLPRLKSRIQLLTQDCLLPTLWNTSKHTLQFAQLHSEMRRRDGHLLVATHGGDGKARIWEESASWYIVAYVPTIFKSRLCTANYFQLFLPWIPLALLKGGAVCGASHAALGEPLYLIPKLRSDICQSCHHRHSILCIQLLHRGGGRT